MALRITLSMDVEAARRLKKSGIVPRRDEMSVIDILTGEPVENANFHAWARGEDLLEMGLCAAGEGIEEEQGYCVLISQCRLPVAMTAPPEAYESQQLAFDGLLAVLRAAGWSDDFIAALTANCGHDPKRLDSLVEAVNRAMRQPV